MAPFRLRKKIDQLLHYMNMLPRWFHRFMLLISFQPKIHNGSTWLEDCFKGIMSQNTSTSLEVSIYNDSSTDDTAQILTMWQSKLKDNPNVQLKVSSGEGPPKGVGFAKNRAVEQSSGRFLCFQDVDDVMFPSRISLQIEEAKKYPNAIIGSRFIREPSGSTHRFTRWANEISQEKLAVQIYTSHGPTVVMPTWFCSRSLFESVGGFSEDGKGTPEDLIFFYRHLDLDGHIRRVDEILLMYRYHESATTFSIHEDTIWNIRVKRLIEKELLKWSQFTIWNAGKQGRSFYRSLSPSIQDKVVAMCDVDQKKIGKTYKPYHPDDKKKSQTSRSIPIISYKDAKPPFVICIKLDLTAGNFELNLASLNLIEGIDYILFS